MTLCALFHPGLLELGLHLEMIELTRLHGLGGDDLVDERTIPHGRGQPLVGLSEFFTPCLVFKLGVLLYRFNFWCQGARMTVIPALLSAMPQVLAQVAGVH